MKLTSYEIFKKGDALSDKQLQELIDFYNNVNLMLGYDIRFGFMLNELRYVAETCIEFQHQRTIK